MKLPPDTRVFDYRAEEGEIIHHFIGKINTPLTGLEFKPSITNLSMY